MRNIKTFAILAVCTFAILLVTSGCGEQDLKAQNEAQKKQIAELQSKLQTANLKLEQLQRELDNAKGSGGAEVDSLQQTIKALEEDIAKKKKPIDHVTIQQIHEVVTAGILEEAGKYRSKNVRITGAVKTPPDWSNIVKLMDGLIEKISESKTHPVETAAYLHHRFVQIHPFIDGNGRVARLLTNLYLIAWGYPAIVLKTEDRGKYYKFLRAADAGNLGTFANFIAKAVDESLTMYLSIYGGIDELLPLKELAKGTPYSQEYLSLRARQGILDAVKTGKAWYSSKRALEEYLSEHGMK